MTSASQAILQTVAAVGGFLEKGLAFCRERGIDPETIVESRIIADMQPFRFQIQQVALHSIGAIDSIKAGARRFPGERPAARLRRPAER